ncbi:tRNA 2-thiocytidine biosynthesis protein TtcA [bacterium]|nr:tRNA 2-thiocytidine biosynthesis protein TtcA [bacterium]
MVGLSGGADSSALFKLITQSDLRWYNKVEFIPIHVDPGFVSSDTRIKDTLSDFCATLGYELISIDTNIAEIAFREDARFNPCFTCSRMRRKVLIEKAEELKCNKIALAHHKEDIIETLFLNIFFGKEISTMVPLQELFEGRFYLIRPLAFCNENYLKKYAERLLLPNFSDICPHSGKTKRHQIKKMLENFEKDNPGIRENVFRALFNVNEDYLLQKFIAK